MSAPEDFDIQVGGPGLSFEETVRLYPEAAVKALRELGNEVAALRFRAAQAERTVDAIRKAVRSHIDGRDLFQPLRGAHFINIRVRKNGDWREVEGDWLMGIDRALRAPRPPGSLISTTTYAYAVEGAAPPSKDETPSADPKPEGADDDD